MPKLKPKKVTLIQAISEYMEDRDISMISDEENPPETEQVHAKCEETKLTAMEIAQRVAQEMGIDWNEEDLRECLESAGDGELTEYDVRNMLEAAEEAIQDQKVPHKNMMAAKRRKQKARRKKRIRKNAIDADKNYAKRNQDEMMFTSSRGGYVVSDPKSRVKKTERLWKKAEKMKLVDESMRPN